MRDRKASDGGEFKRKVAPSRLIYGAYASAVADLLVDQHT